jgi:hypothetical protein
MMIWSIPKVMIIVWWLLTLANAAYKNGEKVELPSLFTSFLYSCGWWFLLGWAGFFHCAPTWAFVVAGMVFLLKFSILSNNKIMNTPTTMNFPLVIICVGVNVLILLYAGFKTWTI